jgi:hypothetical protein
LIVASYLMAQRGKGTFVANTQNVQSIVTYRQVYEHLEQAFTAASGLGMTASAFGSAAYAQAVMVSQRQVQTVKVAFVDRLQHSPKIHTVLQSELGIEPVLVELSAVEGKPTSNKDFLDADLIITLAQHLDVVKKQASDIQEVIALDVKPNLLLLAEISALPLNTQVLVIGNNTAEAEIMQQVLVDAGVNHVQYKLVAAKEIKPDMIKQSAVALIAPDVAATTVSGDIKAVPFNVNIEQANLLLIKARLATVKAAKNLT